MSDDPLTQKSTMFDIYSNPFTVWGPPTCTNFNRLWDSPGVDCSSWQDVLSGHPGVTNVISSVSRLSPDDKFLGAEHSESSINAMISSEQKNIAPMKYLVHEFSKPVQLVLYHFAVILSNSKPCSMVETFCCFLGCEKDVRCFENSIPNFVNAYIYQLLKQVLDLTGDEELM